jgi:hypothetical protein
MRHVSVLFHPLKKIYMFVVPSYQVEDLKIVTLQKNQLSLFLNQVNAKNRESLFFTESRQYIRSAPSNRVFSQNGFEVYTDV